MARKSSGGGIWLVAGGLVLIAMVPKEVWIAVGILPGLVIATFLLVWAFRHTKRLIDRRAVAASTKKQRSEEPTLAELMARDSKNWTNAKPIRANQAKAFSAPVATSPVVAFSQSDKNDEFYSAPPPPSTVASLHPIPPAPEGFGEGQWIPPGNQVQVAEIDLPGGMIYVGSRMDAPNGITDPCLIDGSLLLATHVGSECTPLTGYWPSYTDASPNERRAYLHWLSEGRSNPECDIGYVFLFLYGLERRVILDSRDSHAAKGDWPAIIGELRRLLAIYGEKSRSFMRYAGELLSWIELEGISNRLYEKPVPKFLRSYELPPYLRLALGQASVDHAPLPASLALAWVRLSPDTHLRTAATRCPDEFERLFVQRYHEALGAGLVLPKNRTKLKFVYQAASSGLRGTTISMDFGEIPDVTALTAPIKRLKVIADQCTDELGSYSRLVGKDPSLAGSLDSLLLLPVPVWPVATKTKLDALTRRVRESRLTISLQELFDSLGGTEQSPNRDRVRGLARALEGAHIGMEPNVLGGAKTPGALDKVVLFAQEPVDGNAALGGEYQTAVLTLELAAALAEADGDFSAREIEHLRTAIDRWLHLGAAERCRLRAHLQWLIVYPPTLTALRRKLEPLPTGARETVAAFMVALAQSDGFVSPEEVRFLEKIYKALGVDPTRVFSDVHAAGARGSVPGATERDAKQGFHLDAAKIAALRKDEERLSDLLSKIFVEEAPSPVPSLPLEEEIGDIPPSPLGLDEHYSTFVRLLLSRHQWTRPELEDAAADLDLMLDGALEQINEAAFERFDAPFCEGDDPVDINVELREKIEA